MRITKFLSVSLVVFFYSISANAALDLAKIKLELAKLESVKDKDEGFARCEKLMAQLDESGEEEKNPATYYTWEGIVVAKMAHYKAPAISALSLAKDARRSLEKAVELDETNSNAAALNALGIIYHRVPRFISFGNDKKSEEYFKRANAVSSNLDTNWRYGEFLVEEGRKEEGLKLLKLALSKANSSKADEVIKAKIIRDLIKENEQQ